jgi:hypothetical protein
MFSIVYLPGLLAPEFLQLRLDIVTFGSGGRIQGDNRFSCANVT